jgi:hypothetical protein
VKSPVSDGHPLVKPATPGDVLPLLAGPETENEQVLQSFPVRGGKRAFQISPKPMPTAASSTSTVYEPVLLPTLCCDCKDDEAEPHDIHVVVEPRLVCQPPPSTGGVLSAFGSFLSRPVTRGDVLAAATGWLLGYAIGKVCSRC